METEELWRPIIGFEDTYSVSSLGRIRRDARSKGATVGLILRPQKHTMGYLMVMLWRNNERTPCLIHRAVAQAFLGLIPNECEVNHKDGNKKNNWLTNLEYVTQSGNSFHAASMGLLSRISPHRMFTEYDVREIRTSPMTGNSLAKKFGVHRQVIYSIRRGRTYKDVKVEAEG